MTVPSRNSSRDKNEDLNLTIIGEDRPSPENKPVVERTSTNSSDGKTSFGRRIFSGSGRKTDSGKFKGIKVSGFSGRLGLTLKSIDVNNDGIIDEAEFAEAVEGMIVMSNQTKFWRMAAILNFIFVVIQSGVMAGIVYGIVVANQQVKVENNYLFSASADGNNVPVVTANYAWQNNFNLTNFMNTPAAQLKTISAITIAQGDLEIFSNVLAVVAVNLPERTILMTTPDAVITFKSTGMNVTWTNPVLEAGISEAEQGSAPVLRRVMPSCCAAPCGYSTGCACCGSGGNLIDIGSISPDI